MTSIYWNQLCNSEVMSMLGLSHDFHCDDDNVVDCNDECEDKEDRHLCPRCTGRGCNYCLMLN